MYDFIILGTRKHKNKLAVNAAIRNLVVLA